MRPWNSNGRCFLDLALVQQLMMESLLLAFVGAAAGCLLAGIAVNLIPSLVPPDVFPAESVIELNAPVLAFTAALSIMTALIFGLAPDLRDLTTVQLQRKYEELFGQASHSNHKDYRLR